MLLGRQNDGNRKTIKCITWPSQSLDLNIIENVWRTIKIRLQSQITDVKNRTQLVAKMKEIWTFLSITYGVYMHQFRKDFVRLSDQKVTQQNIRNKG
jgi:hypothetical protein